MSSENKIWYNKSMKLLIPTAKEMNTSLPTVKAKALRPESQAILEELATYSVQELESFYKILPKKRKRSTTIFMP